MLRVLPLAGLDQSVVGNVVLGDGGSIPTLNAFGTGPGQLGGFMMGVTVPEPGTLALMALGSASLLLFRRKNIIFVASLCERRH